ncbi:hypothetical protein U9M48_041261 [Paspalum notatum var. saurae]|uniref:Uncharacterized protein n=1 Tax=Paspalum notatum var. saurae TaxID=547442 RepID=A0AAQ3USS1_PASNO
MAMAPHRQHEPLQ